jgi:hypothetical protein
MRGLLMNTEMERIWKEALMDLIDVLWCILLEGLKKITKTPIKIADVPEEIQTEHLPNTSLEPYRCYSLFVPKSGD